MGVLLFASAASAGQVATNLPFSVDGASMWGTGPAFSFSQSKFFGLDETLSVNLNKTVSDPLDVDTVGFGVTGSITAKVGVEASFTVDSGTLDITYPAAAEVSFPDIGHQGNAVTIAPSTNMPAAATMMTRSPQVSAALKLPFLLEAQASGFVNPPVLSEVPFTLVDLPRFDQTYTFFDINPGDAELTLEFPTVDIPGVADKGDFGSITASIPIINTSATGSGGTIQSSGSDSIIQLNVDLDDVASTVFPSIPSLNGDLTVSGVGFTYDLLDLDGNIDVNASQDFTFSSTLMARYTLETGQVIVQEADAPLTITLPKVVDVGGELDVMVEYFLENSLINKTNIDVVPSLGVTVLSGTVNFGSFGSVALGPVFNDPNFLSTTFSFNVFEQQFALDFPTFTTSFSITVVPEPSSALLSLVAILFLLLATRRKSPSG